jgi:hypothetical protein
MAEDEKLYTDIVNSIKEVGQLFDEILKTQDMNEKKRKYTLINEKIKLIPTIIKNIKMNKKDLYTKYKDTFDLINKTISNYIKEKEEKKTGYLEKFRIEISDLSRKIKIEEAKTKLNESRTESFMQAYNRSLVFLYYKMKEIPIPEKKYQLESNEKKELLNAIHSFKEKGDHEKMSLELFHTSKDEFDKELIRYEKGVGILNYNTKYARRTYEVGRSFSGLMSLLGKSERQLQYIADYSDHICNEKDINKYCKSIVNNIESYDALPDEGKTKEYILVKKEFFPESSTVPILINYKRLPLISFLLDAFLNDGVLEITPELEEKMKKDYPELFLSVEKERYNVEKALKRVNQTRKQKNGLNSALNNLTYTKQILKNKINRIQTIKSPLPKLYYTLKGMEIPRGILVLTPEQENELKKMLSDKIQELKGTYTKHRNNALKSLNTSSIPDTSDPYDELIKQYQLDPSFKKYLKNYIHEVETNREIQELKSPTNSLNNSLKILNTDRPELRIRKRIGTIRKKISTVKSLASALKKGGRRTRKSRK